jgi:hypothetical protein
MVLQSNGFCVTGSSLLLLGSPRMYSTDESNGYDVGNNGYHVSK